MAKVTIISIDIAVFSCSSHDTSMTGESVRTVQRVPIEYRYPHLLI